MIPEDMTLIWLVGSLTLVVSMMVKFIGLPNQIRINHLRKSVEGVSMLFIFLLWLSYLLWATYGFLRGDVILMVGHGLGVFTAGIILTQAWVYKKKPTSS